MFIFRDVSIEIITKNKILHLGDKLQIMIKYKNDKEDTKGKFHLQSNYRRAYELVKNTLWIKLTTQ